MQQRKRISSDNFYEDLKAILPETAELYELVGNKRQSDELARRSDSLRKALLEYTSKDINTHFFNEISNIPRNKFFTTLFSSLSNEQTVAILTRNNGEAEWVSALLHKENIKHNLLRSVTPRLSLNRWLADMFWDYREPRMSRDDFLERYMIRITADELSASLVYDALVNSLQGTGANDTYFGLASLNRVLRTTQDLSPLMTNSHYRGLTVSTIHKAKGREFDHVYLLSGFNPSDENTAEARVWYVGSTRPKSRLDPLEVSKKLYVSKPTEMNRRVLKGYAFNRSYCSRIVIGLPDDINNYSFIEGDLHHALDTQQYLSTSVELNDAVELVRMDNLYRVIHNGTIIGSLRPETTKDFWAAIRMTGNKKNIPPRLMEIYVSNIITVVPRQFPSGADAMFKESGFWLGIELTGFAKVDWDYGGVRQ